MGSKVWTATSIIGALLLIAIAIISFAFGYCGGTIECSSGAVPMKCYWGYQAAGTIGIIGSIMAVLGIFAKEKGARIYSAIASILACAGILLVLFALIGVCGKAEMSCNSMRTVVAVLCAIDIVVAIVSIVKADPAASAKPKRGL